VPLDSRLSQRRDKKRHGTPRQGCDRAVAGRSGLSTAGSRHPCSVESCLSTGSWQRRGRSHRPLDSRLSTPLQQSLDSRLSTRPSNLHLSLGSSCSHHRHLSTPLQRRQRSLDSGRSAVKPTILRLQGRERGETPSLPPTAGVHPGQEGRQGLDAPPHRRAALDTAVVKPTTVFRIILQPSSLCSIPVSRPPYLALVLVSLLRLLRFLAPARSLLQTRRACLTRRRRQRVVVADVPAAAAAAARRHVELAPGAAARASRRQSNEAPETV
jgi:hypothetical protein